MTSLALLLLLQAAGPIHQFEADSLTGKVATEDELVFEVPPAGSPEPYVSIQTTPDGGVDLVAHFPGSKGTKDGCSYLYIWRDDYGHAYQRVAFCVEVERFCVPGGNTWAILSVPDDCEMIYTGEATLKVECAPEAAACEDRPIQERRLLKTRLEEKP